MRRGVHAMSAAYALERVGEGVGDDVGAATHLAAGDGAVGHVHAPFAFFEVEADIAQIEADVFIPLVGGANAEPVAIEVRHGGWTEIRIIDRRAVEGDAAASCPFVRQLVFRTDRETPRVLPLHFLLLRVGTSGLVGHLAELGVFVERDGEFVEDGSFRPADVHHDFPFVRDGLRDTEIGDGGEVEISVGFAFERAVGRAGKAAVQFEFLRHAGTIAEAQLSLFKRLVGHAGDVAESGGISFQLQTADRIVVTRHFDGGILDDEARANGQVVENLVGDGRCRFDDGQFGVDGLESADPFRIPLRGRSGRGGKREAEGDFIRHRIDKVEIRNMGPAAAVVAAFASSRVFGVLVGSGGDMKPVAAKIEGGSLMPSGEGRVEEDGRRLIYVARHAGEGAAQTCGGLFKDAESRTFHVGRGERQGQCRCGAGGAEEFFDRFHDFFTCLFEVTVCGKKQRNEAYNQYCNADF